ncbi:MAG: hypothetical protein NTZ14_16285 [Hyphomicrobiales bacterium]|nr:hypothetical protein [Hyphomicrobiales bacterium]
MADAIGHLASSGDAGPQNLIAHTSPVGWAHIAFSDDVLWDGAARTTA